MDFNAHLDTELLQHMKLFSRENCTWQRRMWWKKKKHKTRFQQVGSGCRNPLSVALMWVWFRPVLCSCWHQFTAVCWRVWVELAASGGTNQTRRSGTEWRISRELASCCWVQLLLRGLTQKGGGDMKKQMRNSCWKMEPNPLITESHRATGDPAPSKNSELTCCRRATSGTNIFPLKHAIKYLFHEMFNSNNSTRLNLF